MTPTDGSRSSVHVTLYIVMTYTDFGQVTNHIGWSYPSTWRASLLASHS